MEDCFLKFKKKFRYWKKDVNIKPELKAICWKKLNIDTIIVYNFQNLKTLKLIAAERNLKQTSSKLKQNETKSIFLNNFKKACNIKSELKVSVAES